MESNDRPVRNAPGRTQVDAYATQTPAGSGLGLDGVLLRSLVARRLPGGWSELQDLWVARDTSQRGAAGQAPHRSTMHRWTQGQMPRTAGDLLRLCGILDVDPLALLRLPPSEETGALERLVRAYVHGRWQPPALEFLHDFLGRRSVWPPPSPALEHFGRDWHVHDFSHDPVDGANQYATVRILPPSSPPRATGEPRVWHFAYRHERLFGRRWLQYGVVSRVGRQVTLLHINGHEDSIELQSEVEVVQVQTWFGPGAAVFRVASLHEFSLDVVFPCDRAGGPWVRFPG